MKLAVKYLPGCGGEFILSLISSIIDDKPFSLNEKNHYHATEFGCGHQGFGKFISKVYLTDRPDYASLVSDSAGKSNFVEKDNIFKHYDRITMHLWSLNIMAEMQYRNFNNVLVIEDSDGRCKILAKAKLGVLVGVNDTMPEEEWDKYLYDKADTHSERKGMYDYANKAFNVTTVTYEELYNSTFEETRTLISNFCDVAIDESHYNLIGKYYEKNQSIIDSYLSTRTN
jgi:hypothetical protein|tara:strand:+ start:1064 stop:1747 length:684 start_codon:yes stop_codon:yes gene_type:complete